MGLMSSRLAIGQAIVALLTGIIDPATSLPVYSLCQLGAVFNPSNNTAWCEVTHLQGQGKPAGSGGNMVGFRIEDETQWLITSGIGPYELDSPGSQASMLNIQDVVLPVLHSHFQIPQAGNPALAVQSVYSVLPIQIDRSRPIRWPNGHFYLMWYLPIIVKSQYNIGFVSP